MAKARAGFFLVIEGLDGSGKTQASRRLQRILQETHAHVELTFEPYDPLCAGLFIRHALTKRISNVAPRTLALAFALNRADHGSRVIQPYLEQYETGIMLCDRYYLSSLVYQSTADLSMQEVMHLNERALRPDLTLFLSASAQTCYERMRKRPEDKELFEKNLGETRQKYHEAMAFLRERGETIVEINADGSIESVLNAMLDQLASLGPRWLQLQRTLIEPSLDVYSLDGIGDAEAALDTFVARLASQSKAEPYTASDTVRAAILDMKTAVEDEVNQLSYDELGSLFLGYLERWGYRRLDQLPWTETCAYELEYSLPLGLRQRGTAILLTETQRHDLITRKTQQLLDEALNKDLKDGKEISRLSDFMFVLDPVSSPYAEPTPERDASYSRISPNVRKIQRSDIARFCLGDILVNQYGDGVGGEFEYAEFLKVLDELNLMETWDNAKRQRHPIQQS